MRHLALIALAFLWVTPAHAETTKAPDGFGPIKFGMTKEEAWAAIEGKGEWKSDTELTYKLDISKWLVSAGEVVVNQSFSEGKAYYTNVLLIQRLDYDVECWTSLAFLLDMLLHRYGIRPTRIETRPSGHRMRSADVYTFAHPDSSKIFVTYTQYSRDRGETLLCNLDISYAAPVNYDDPEGSPF